MYGRSGVIPHQKVGSWMLDDYCWVSLYLNLEGMRIMAFQLSGSHCMLHPEALISSARPRYDNLSPGAKPQPWDSDDSEILVVVFGYDIPVIQGPDFLFLYIVHVRKRLFGTAACVWLSL